jgi:peptide/nickel transport system substrate-binding protein
MRRTWIALASAIAIAAGCTSCDVSTAAPAGGQPVLGSVDEITDLDPAAAYDQGSWNVFGNTFQTLLTLPAGADQPVPDAASNCNFTDSTYTTYQCTLRSNLHFSNGDPLTAVDAAYSFTRIKSINSPQGPSPLLSTLGSATASGNTVTFHLTSPDATFPFKLATGAGSIVDHLVYPADKPLGGNRLVGSGVYEIKSYTPGQSLVLAPNSDYSGADHLANGGATIRYFTNSQALATALAQHQVDFVEDGLPPAVENSYQTHNSGGFSTFEDSGTGIDLMVFDTTRAPFDNVAVRRAVAQAVDRESLARDVYDRTVQPLYSLVPEGISGHTTPYFDRYGAAGDAGKARAILQSAGVHAPVAFTLTVPTGDIGQAEAQALAKQLNATGLFSVTVHNVPWDTFEQGSVTHQYEAYEVGWSPDFPDADDFIAPLIGSGNAFHNGYSNPSIDSLITQTRAQANRAATGSLFAQAEDTEAADVPILPLWQGKAYAVARSNIQGVPLSTSASGVTCLWTVSVGSGS